jgi:hypothetical protein
MVDWYAVKMIEMTGRNQYGLTRNIPADVKREVRQRCGFGCAVCGSAIVEYEHLAPDFAHARQHRADGIVLLCPSCHARKTRNFLSRRRVIEASNAPAAKKAGFAFSELEATRERPYVVFAGVTLVDCVIPVMVRALPLLQFEPAETRGGPYRLSASFFDRNGRPSLFIRENEWQVFSETWDVEAKAGVIEVRTAPGEIALRLRLDPGAGLLVERLSMHCFGYKFEGDTGTLAVTDPSGVQIGSRTAFQA